MGSSTLSHTSSLVGCNNEAEAARLDGRTATSPRPGSARAIAVRSDSNLLIEQLRPPQPASARCPDCRLAELFDSARAWLARFDSVQWQWIPRHRNSAADTWPRCPGRRPRYLHPSHKKKALNLCSKAPPAPWASVAMSLLRH